MIVAAGYLGLCFIIALLGANRKFGFLGYFFCSLFLTPVIGALVLLASDERRPETRVCPRCAYPLTETKPDPGPPGQKEIPA